MTAAPEILKPVDAAEVARAIVWAGETRRRVEPRGGGSKAAIGRPVSPDVILDMSGLSGIIDYAPAELVLTARAGTPLSEIETALVGAGQMLAFEPIDYAALLGGRAGAATLGGVIAANASGPRRLKDGAARDHFLGFAAVSGRGEAFKAGGKVVKNVTGYDLAKLVAGSWGTFCVLTEVTLKVLPRPQTAVTVVLAGLGDADAARAMSLAVGSPADISGAAHLPEGIAASTPLEAALRGGPATLLRLEGFGPSVEARIAFLRERLAAFAQVAILEGEATAVLWSHIRDVRAFAGDDRPVWRISTAPMAGPKVLAAIQAETAGEGFYDWAGGLIWVAVPRSADAAADSVRRAAAVHGGHATLIRAPAETRASVPVFEPEPPALAALSARVKAGFDPLAILNPGRMRPETA